MGGVSALWARLKALGARRAPLLALLLLAGALLVLSGQGSGSDGMTQEEKRVARTLSSIAGAGEVRITIFYAQQPSAFSSGSKTPTGAVVVARGARDIAVRLDLSAAVQALLSLPPQSVTVFSMEDAP